MIWRRSIWDEFRRMQEEMDRLFSTIMREPYWTGVWEEERIPVETSMYRQPLADIWETDDEIIATIELPGVEKEDIQVNVVDDYIEVKVEKKEEHKEEDKKKGMYRLERRYSGFYRRIPLPEEADADSIKATYKNGVLELRIPKKKTEKKKGKKVKVE